MMKKKYNVEKVLYFADGDQGLHVSPSEKDRNTDLHQIVAQQLAAGHIQLAATDDAGDYYTITTSGKISLLVRQINWRKRNGKCIERHCAELDRLTHERHGTWLMDAMASSSRPDPVPDVRNAPNAVSGTSSRDDQRLVFFFDN